MNSSKQINWDTMKSDPALQSSVPWEQKEDLTRMIEFNQQDFAAGDRRSIPVSNNFFKSFKQFYYRMHQPVRWRQVQALITRRLWFQEEITVWITPHTLGFTLEYSPWGFHIDVQGITRRLTEMLSDSEVRDKAPLFDNLGWATGSWASLT